MAHRDRQFFQALAALAEQVWVLRDRQRIVEAVLARHGLDLREEIDRYQPDAALAGELDAERQRFIAAVLAGFATDHDDG